MFVPEFLYQLSARDQQRTWLDPVLVSLSANVAGVEFNSNVFLIPNDKVMIVNNLVLAADPGAAQACIALQLSLLVPTALSFIPIARTTFAAVLNENQALNWSGSLVAPPGYAVNMLGTFDAGVAANQITGTVVGILIPVGNIQRV